MPVARASGADPAGARFALSVWTEPHNPEVEMDFGGKRTGNRDRPASWRMPTPKQMEKLAAEAARRTFLPAAAPDAGTLPAGRCERTVEIQTVDAVRLYGAKAIWKEVGQRLLDDT